MSILDRPADPNPLKQQSSTLSDSSIPESSGTVSNGAKPSVAGGKAPQQVHSCMPADETPLQRLFCILTFCLDPEHCNEYIMMAGLLTSEIFRSHTAACMQAKADARAEKAAKIISLASLLLLFVAVALYTGLSIIGWNAYIAAAALFSAGLAGYPLLTLLTHAVASQTSRSFTRLGSYDRCGICLAKLYAMMLNLSVSVEAHSLQVACCLTTGTTMVSGLFSFCAYLETSLIGMWTAPDIQMAASVCVADCCERTGPQHAAAQGPEPAGSMC